VRDVNDNGAELTCTLVATNGHVTLLRKQLGEQLGLLLQLTESCGENHAKVVGVPRGAHLVRHQEALDVAQYCGAIATQLWLVMIARDDMRLLIELHQLHTIGKAARVDGAGIPSAVSERIRELHAETGEVHETHRSMAEPTILHLEKTVASAIAQIERCVAD
jgi:hypothetical protein